MTDRNANRPGYKKTKVGWIPEEWDVIHLDDISEINKDNLSSSTSGDYSFTYINLGDVNSGSIEISSDKITFSSAPSRARRIIHKGDVLLSTVRPYLKGFAYIDFFPNDVICSTGFAVITPNNGIDGYFLYQYIFSEQAERYFNACVVGSNYPALNNSDIKNIRIPLPPLPQQKRIAEILSAWDRAIEQTRKLIDAKRRLKQGLMQQLLTGRMRFPGFDAPVEKAGELPEGWKEKPLRHFLTMRLRKEEKSKHPFDKLGIRSHGKGIFIKKNESPSSYSMDYFYRVKEDDIVVNITFAWEGAIALVGPEGNNALVSHRFPTYVVNKKVMDVQYLKYLIHTNRFFYDLGTISPGGAGRNRVMVKSDFLRIKVKFPPVDEQKQISDLLKTLDNQIEGLKSLSTNYIQQKHGLMQKLLNGEKRAQM